jgi:hypothetical protein
MRICHKREEEEIAYEVVKNEKIMYEIADEQPSNEGFF